MTTSAAHSRGGGAAVTLDDALTNNLVHVLWALRSRRRGWVEFLAVRLASGLTVGLAVDVTLVILIPAPGSGRGRGVADQRTGLRAAVENVASGSSIFALPVVDLNLALKVAGEVVGVARLLVGRAAAIVLDITVTLVVAIALVYLAAAAATPHVVPVVLDDSVALHDITTAATSISSVALIVAVAFVVAVLLVAVTAAHGGQGRIRQTGNGKRLLAEEKAYGESRRRGGR